MYSTNYRKKRKLILKRDNHICTYCGQEATTVDHIIPLSKGGTDDDDNLTSACTTCNYGKKNKDPLKFAEKKFAEQITKIKKNNGFFGHDSRRTHSFVSFSPRDFGVFEPLKNERKIQDAS